MLAMPSKHTCSSRPQRQPPDDERFDREMHEGYTALVYTGQARLWKQGGGAYSTSTVVHVRTPRQPGSTSLHVQRHTSVASMTMQCTPWQHHVGSSSGCIGCTVFTSTHLAVGLSI